LQLLRLSWEELFGWLMVGSAGWRFNGVVEVDTGRLLVGGGAEVEVCVGIGLVVVVVMGVVVAVVVVVVVEVVVVCVVSDVRTGLLIENVSSVGNTIAGYLPLSDVDVTLAVASDSSTVVESVVIEVVILVVVVGTVVDVVVVLVDVDVEVVVVVVVDVEVVSSGSSPLL